MINIEMVFMYISMSVRSYDGVSDFVNDYYSSFTMARYFEELRYFRQI